MKDNRDLLELSPTGKLIIGCNKNAVYMVIPEGVVVIGPYAFSCCDMLESILIPNSVTTIDIGAFWGCEKLKEVYLPNSVTTIRAGAFGGCRALKTLEIPDSVNHIGEGAFGGCDKLRRFIISQNHPFIRYENGDLYYKEDGKIIFHIHTPKEEVSYAYKVTNYEDEFQRLRKLLEEEMAKNRDLICELEMSKVEKKSADEKNEYLQSQLELEKAKHEQTKKELENMKKELAKLKECPSEEPNNSITIDDMISIIGEQATAEDAKTISDALTIIVLEKGMKVTKEQNKKMKANLAKLANPSPMVSTGTNSGIMASNINIQMPEEERKQLTSSMKK